MNGRNLCTLNRSQHDLIWAHDQIRSMATSEAHWMEKWESASNLICGCTALLPSMLLYSFHITLSLQRLSMCAHTWLWAYCMLKEPKSQAGFSTSQLCQILHWCSHVNPLVLFICFLRRFKVFLIIFLLKRRSCRPMKSSINVLLESHLVLWSQIGKASST